MTFRCLGYFLIWNFFLFFQDGRWLLCLIRIFRNIFCDKLFFLINFLCQGFLVSLVDINNIWSGCWGSSGLHCKKKYFIILSENIIRYNKNWKSIIRIGALSLEFDDSYYTLLYFSIFVKKYFRQANFFNKYNTLLIYVTIHFHSVFTTIVQSEKLFFFFVKNFSKVC